MYDGFRADDLTAALRELDAAKALVRKRQAELGEAVREFSHSGCLQKPLRIFETKARKMNLATKRYLVAVRAFTAACQRSHNHALEESEVRRIASIG